MCLMLYLVILQEAGTVRIVSIDEGPTAPSRCEGVEDPSESRLTAWESCVAHARTRTVPRFPRRSSGPPVCAPYSGSFSANTILNHLQKRGPYFRSLER